MKNAMPANVTSLPDTFPSTCNGALLYGGVSNQRMRYACDKVGDVANLATGPAAPWSSAATDGKPIGTGMNADSQKMGRTAR